jgi:DNA-binding HxlR family transcriptional regulator
VSWNNLEKSACAVARTLVIVGDRWTLLILRELFLGVFRFEEIQAETGVSSHLLSARLRRLKSEGILKRMPYSQRPLRYEYRLTEKGLDLYPVILGLKAWGEEWAGFKAGSEPSTRLVHTQCGHGVALELICPACREPFGPRDVRATFSKKFAIERSRRRAAFLRKRVPTARTTDGRRPLPKSGRS